MLMPRMTIPTTSAAYFEELAEKRHDADTSYPRRLFAKAAPIPTKMLHCALFRVADKRVKRVGQLKKVFPLSSGGFLAYKGPELRQDDGHVFAALAHLTAGFGPEHGATFKPAEFVKLLGWSKSPYSTQRLDECLGRLRDASLTFYNSVNEKEWLTGLVLEINYTVPNKPNHWHVSLSYNLRKEAFDYFSQTTQLNMAILEKLPTGLVSWLYGFILSNQCDKPFVLEDLRILSGSGTKCAKEWGKQVRAALDVLQERKITLGYESRRGSVFVQKNPVQPRE
jgi:hypothetical protein